MDGQRSAVIGVIGGCGGIGASRFAAVLASTAAAHEGAVAATIGGLLVDLDPAGGGIDVLLGIEAVAGARWSGLRLAGGVLDAHHLLSGLPSWGRVAVLACDRAELPSPDQVVQVLHAARSAVVVVVDLTRYAGDVRTAALACCTVVVLVCGCDLAAITAARSVLIGISVAAAEAGELAPPPVVVVARGRRAAATRAAGLIGAPLAARLPATRGRQGARVRPGDVTGPARRVARGVLTGLGALPVAASSAPQPPVPVATGWVPWR